VQGGVGTFGGSEDHAAILTGRRNELRLLSFCPTRPASFSNMDLDMDGSIINQAKISSYGSGMDDWGEIKNNNPTLEEALPISTSSSQESVVHLSSELAFVIAYSGAKAEKAGGVEGATDASIGFNSASDLASRALGAYLAGGGGGDNIEGSVEDVQTLADAIRWERSIADTTSNERQSVKASITKRIKAGTAAVAAALSTTTNEKITADDLVRRFEQFYDESEYLVPSAAYAISQKRYYLLGPIVDASHRGAVNSLKNQIEETAWLPLWARGVEEENDLACRSSSSSSSTEPLFVASKHATGSKADLMNQFESLDVGMDTKNRQKPKRIRALAASAFGAGFGGSCWALVHRTQAREFARQWREAYDDRFPAKTNGGGIGGLGMREFFVTDPGPGAFCV